MSKDNEKKENLSAYKLAHKRSSKHYGPLIIFGILVFIFVVLVAYLVTNQIYMTKKSNEILAHQSNCTEFQLLGTFEKRDVYTACLSDNIETKILLNTYSIPSDIVNNKIRIEKFISKLHKAGTLNDGGTTIFYNDDLVIVSCHKMLDTLDQYGKTVYVDDIIIGDSSFGYSDDLCSVKLK